MKIKDEITTTEQFELDISMEELLKVISDGLKNKGYYMYHDEPYLDTYEDSGRISVELCADEAYIEDIFDKHFAEELLQVLKDKANNDKQKGETNETND